jgi:diguanylate cyclase (GGDEF)-like protein
MKSKKIEELEKELAKLRKEQEEWRVTKELLLRVNASWERSLFELSTINKVHCLSHLSLDYRCISGEILKLLSSMLDFHIASVYLNQDKIHYLELLLQDDVPSNLLEDYKARIQENFPKHKYPCEQKINKGEMMVKGRRDKEVVKIESFLVFPCIARAQVIGNLAVAHLTKENIYREEEVKLLKLVAESSSLALENAILYFKLEELAITDSLTSLYNRRYFKEYLNSEKKRAKRYNLKFALSIGDIDDFKKINDTYGHLVGDKVLLSIANVLTDGIRRESDIVCRWGGEEFAILMPNNSKETAKICLERIRENIKERVWREVNLKEYVTMSFGVAAYPDDALLDTELINQADSALYQAKRLGKNRVILC